MAGPDAKPKVVTVNGSTSAYNPTVQDDITMALLQNGGVRRIQAALQQRLDEVGWTQNVREYVERLFRSGEATTYDDALKIVTQHIGLQPDAVEGKATANGNVNGSGAPDLTIPREAAESAAEIVRKELTGIVKVDK